MARPRSAPPKSLGNAIRDARERAGMTQAELADALGVTQNLVGRLEAGGRNDPRTSTLVRLCKTLGTSLDELVGAAGLLPDAAARSGRDSAVPLLRRIREARKALSDLDVALAEMDELVRERPARRRTPR